MRTACSLCGSGDRPGDRGHDVDGDDGAWHLCSPCCGRVAAFVRGADERALSELWILPLEAAEAADAGASRPLDLDLDLDVGDAVYRDLGLLEDTLYEAATAYAEINDDEVKGEALVLLFGLLREGALPRLRARLYPI